jgi:hypothetical protein
MIHLHRGYALVVICDPVNGYEENSKDMSIRLELRSYKEWSPKEKDIEKVMHKV